MAGLANWGRAVGYGAHGGARKAVCTIGLILCTSAAQAEPVTVAALGDSLTQGYGLPQAEGFVPQLQGWLTAQGIEAQVLNAGVSGDTTAGGLSRVDWTLTDDVDALIVALGGNDVLRGIDPAVARANIEGILRAAGERGVPVLLIGITAPTNYGPDYKRDFEALYPELAETYGALYVANFLGALADLPDREAARKTYLQGDQIHPNAAGVALIVERLGPEVAKLLAQVPAPG